MEAESDITISAAVVATAGLLALADVDRNDSGGFTVTPGGSVTSDNVLEVGAAEIELQGNLQGSDHLVLRGIEVATSIGLGGGIGSLNLDDNELGHLVDGFSSITIGPLSGGSGGAVDIETAAFTDRVSIFGAAMSVNGLSSDGTSILLNSSDAVTVEAGGIASSGGDVTITADSDIHVLGNVNAGSANVQLTTSNGNVTGTPANVAVTAATATINELSPGTSPGIFDVTGDAVLAGGSAFAVEIGGGSVGDYDQLAVTGSVNIDNTVTLDLQSFMGYVPTTGDEFVIIDSGTGVTGRFSNLLNEGDEIPDFLGSGLTFAITYAGGADGHDVVLYPTDDDFGDAPAPYPTTLAEDGARHPAFGPRLGSNRDIDADGVHSADADADDLNGSPDEDGVSFGSVQVGQLDATVTVNVQGGTGKLDAWIDFNGDGTWLGAGEHIFDNVAVVNGDNLLTFDVPADADAQDTVARFRLRSSGEVGPMGSAANGEVEDHLVTIVSPTSTAGAFGPKQVVFDMADAVHALAAADLDDDGDVDLLAGSRFDTSLRWFDNDGNQSFTAKTISSSTNLPTGLRVADINGDGDLDVVAVMQLGNEIGWFENDGSENFTFRSIDAGLGEPREIVVADIDSDGDDDVILASHTDETIRGYGNNGPGT